MEVLLEIIRILPLQEYFSGLLKRFWQAPVEHLIIVNMSRSEILFTFTCEGRGESEKNCVITNGEPTCSTVEKMELQCVQRVVHVEPYGAEDITFRRFDGLNYSIYAVDGDKKTTLKENMAFNGFKSLTISSNLKVVALYLNK